MHRLVVHCQRSRYDVYVGRGKCPQTNRVIGFGNKFSHLEDSKAQFRSKSRPDSILDYYEWLMDHPLELDRVLLELPGKVLGCWCQPLECHGDVIAMLANGEIPELEEYLNRLRKLTER